MTREFTSQRTFDARENDKGEIVKTPKGWRYLIDDREVTEAEYRREYQKDFGVAP